MDSPDNVGRINSGRDEMCVYLCSSYWPPGCGLTPPFLCPSFLRQFVAKSAHAREAAVRRPRRPDLRHACGQEPLLQEPWALGKEGVKPGVPGVLAHQPWIRRAMNFVSWSCLF